MLCPARTGTNEALNPDGTLQSKAALVKKPVNLYSLSTSYFYVNLRNEETELVPIVARNEQ